MHVRLDEFERKLDAVDKDALNKRELVEAKADTLKMLREEMKVYGDGLT